MQPLHFIKLLLILQYCTFERIFGIEHEKYHSPFWFYGFRIETYLIAYAIPLSENSLF